MKVYVVVSNDYESYIEGVHSTLEGAKLSHSEGQKWVWDEECGWWETHDGVYEAYRIEEWEVQD